MIEFTKEEAYLLYDALENTHCLIDEKSDCYHSLNGIDCLQFE